MIEARDVALLAQFARPLLGHGLRTQSVGYVMDLDPTVDAQELQALPR